MGLVLFSSHRSRRLLLLLLLGFLLPVHSAFAAKQPTLAPKYQHWLQDDVNYLITKEEKADFLSLPDDAARDGFIERFWKVRNPDLNAPGNEVREEHYRRLTYAQEHFGTRNFGDGVHSDRGMVYITLGPPKQREVHPESPHLRPIEIWFYEDLGGSLPTHFYVLFFRPSFADDYRLYSPYGDRPQKLVDGTDAVNDDQKALRFIDNALGVEAQHVALSLLPGEPNDPKNPQISLQSDVLLSQIRDYRNLASTKRPIEFRRSLEGVSHRLLLGTELSDLTVIASRDGGNLESVHYLFSLRSPEDFGFGRRSDGRYYYALHLRSELLDETGKSVKHADQDLSGEMDAAQVDALKHKAFSAEGRLAATAGKYELRLELTNKVTHVSFQQHRAILVPSSDQALAISQVFFANMLRPTTDASHTQPFSFAGVKLSPRGGENVSVPAGAPLRVIFQLWTTPGATHTAKVELHYLMGRVNGTEKHEEDQTVDASQFDADGNLVIGRDFQTDTMSAGNYRLVIKATDTTTNKTSFQALNFKLADAGSPPPQRWTILVPTAKPGDAAVASTH